MVRESLVGKRIEPACPNVPLQLAIPRSPVELREPLAELGKLLVREGFHVVLDLLNLPHALLYQKAPPAGDDHCRLTLTLSGRRTNLDAKQDAQAGPLQRDVRR
jgi:hypothetical protein